MSKAPTYSLARHLDAIHNHRQLDTPEAAVNFAIKEQFGHYALPGGRHRIAYVPFSAWGTRSDVLGSVYPTFAPIPVQFADGLIAHASAVKAGATVLTGLEGSFHFLGNTGLSQPASAATPEAASPQSEPSFTDRLVGTFSQDYQPQRISAKINVSRNLFRLNPSVFVPTFREICSRAVSSKINEIALYGDANNSSLNGLLQIAPVAALGTTPMTWTNYKGYRSSILKTDISPDSYAVIMSPDFENFADSTQQFTGSSYTIFTKIKDQCPVIIGNDFVHSTLTDTKVLVAGLFRHLYILLWGGGIEILEDWTTQADSNKVVVHIQALINVASVFPNAFQVVHQA
jgi:hypothetical protein